MTIFTIGYEGLNVGTFMSLLADYGIDVLVDVRELPLSRKPGFSKKALEALLNSSNCQYIHMPDLGCPKLIRDRYRKDGNWSDYIKSFMEYLATQEASIATLSALAKNMNCALMCYEADPNFCHRSMVANAVKNHCGNANVVHIKGSAVKIVNTALLELGFV